MDGQMKRTGWKPQQEWNGPMEWNGKHLNGGLRQAIGSKRSYGLSDGARAQLRALMIPNRVPGFLFLSRYARQSQR